MIRPYGRDGYPVFEQEKRGSYSSIGGSGGVRYEYTYEVDVVVEYEQHYYCGPDGFLVNIFGISRLYNRKECEMSQQKRFDARMKELRQENKGSETGLIMALFKERRENPDVFTAKRIRQAMSWPLQDEPRWLSQEEG